MSRWIKLYDKLLSWRWAHKPEYMAFAVHCLLRANPTAWKWEDNEFCEGSFVTSIAHFANEVGISMQTCRTIFKKLQQCEFLTVKSTNKYTLVTICNYARYQENKKRNNKQPTNDQLTTNKQLTTDIDNKNIITHNILIKEEKNKEISVCREETHTEILKFFFSKVKDDKEAERLTYEFIAFNKKNGTIFFETDGLWKMYIERFWENDPKHKKESSAKEKLYTFEEYRVLATQGKRLDCVRDEKGNPRKFEDGKPRWKIL